MSKYQELQARIKELQQEAEQVRKAEMAGAKEQIYAIMREYDLAPADILKSGTPAAKASTKTTAPVAFWGNNGETWSGRGRAPGWIAGKDREKFRTPPEAQSTHAPH